MNYITTALSLLLQHPILVIFDVTRLCNQRCRMCNIWRTKSDDMNIEQIAEQARLLRKHGVGYVFLQGGEPTVRTDLVKIVDVFLENRIKPTVITNGILLRDELAVRLAERPCNVAVSLDTLDRETFKTIRGVDSLDVVKNNIEQASTIKKRRGNWALTTTVTELATLDEIKALESFAANHGFMYAIRPYVHTLGNAGKNDDILSIKDTARIIEIFEYMRGRAYKNNYLAALMYGEHIRYIKGDPQPVCDALRRSMVMSPSGLFAPCLEFTDESAPLEEMLSKKKHWLSRCEKCNKTTPCFYNCVREIRTIWRNKWKIAFSLPKIIVQMAKYGNFF